MTPIDMSTEQEIRYHVVTDTWLHQMQSMCTEMELALEQEDVDDPMIHGVLADIRGYIMDKLDEFEIDDDEPSDEDTIVEEAVRAVDDIDDDCDPF